MKFRRTRTKHLGVELGTPEYGRAVYIKYAYGISYEEYKDIYSVQEGKCAICGIHENDLPKKLHVDHDHISKKVRGLLCFRCNAGIGHLKESEVIMNAAIIYLKRNLEN